MKFKNTIIPLACLLLLLPTGACGGDDSPGNGGEEPTLPGVLDPVAVTKTNPIKLYVHYMPWFEDPTSNNGAWGQHWTMDNCDPNRTDSNGKRQIASRYYPLIGPYASSDTDVLDYHLLLMKYSGIDGVLVDWYGIQDKWDYPANKRNTEALVKAVERAGLEFAIVYEDQTLKDLNKQGQLAQAKQDLKYLENTFFSKECYIQVNGKPLLMTFGPQTIQTPEEWNDVLGSLKTRPTFLTLYTFSASTTNNNQYKNAAGEYLWVDTQPEKAYEKKDNFDVFMGGAMPGFDAYYKEGGWGDNPHVKVDSENGALFRRQLEAARTAGLDYLQLITWNDFGEATNIEPTREWEYRYLTILQQFAGVTYTENVLKEIYRWYELKKQYSRDAAAQKILSQAYYYFVALQADKAGELMNELKK